MFLNRIAVLISLLSLRRVTLSASTSRMSSGCLGSNDTKNETGTPSITYVTAPNPTVAQELASGLVEHRLAACVNIVPSIKSVYVWEGKVQTDDEQLMIIKSHSSRWEELTAYVRKHHPYKVCEVVSFPIAHGNDPYLKWITDHVHNMSPLEKTDPK